MSCMLLFAQEALNKAKNRFVYMTITGTIPLLIIGTNTMIGTKQPSHLRPKFRL